MPGKQRGDRRTVGKIGLHEAELRIRAQDVQPRLLQRRIIIIVEIVQTDDIAALGQQLARDVKADKARRTRDQYCPDPTSLIPQGPGADEGPATGYVLARRRGPRQ